MMDMEEAMAQALDNTFTPYVGKPEHKDGLGANRRSELVNYYNNLKSAAKRAPPEPKALTMRAVLCASATHANIPLRDLMEGSRFVEHTRARHIFYWICRHHMGVSFEKIAAFIHRHHTTVMHGVWKIDRDMGRYTRDIEAIEKMLGVE